MTTSHHRFETQLGSSIFSMEVGKLAKQADGSVLVRYGDTIVLVTACFASKPREGIDFLPLTVDYREYTYAAGKIPGGFFKREGRPSEKEILTSRLIDRPLRPLFPDGYNRETQIIGFVLSADGENNPDVLAITAAATALYISPIPYTLPIAAVRVGMADNEFVVNPTYQQLEESPLDLVVAGSKTAVVMVEGDMAELDEAKVHDAIRFGHENLRKLIELQEEFFTAIKPEKIAVEPKVIDEAIRQEYGERINRQLEELVRIKPKMERQDKITDLYRTFMEEIPEEEEEKRMHVVKLVDESTKKTVRNMILDKNERPDERAFDEIRSISCDVAILPRTHGSSLFTRGETQALVTATLGTSADVQRIDALEGDIERRFMLHYNFPPFSVGEVKFLRGPGRREIGHGALASRSIQRMLPPEEDFPYTVRLVSEILESNGSSSMASVCGGSLALMDAGVPLKEAVSGIAMGLVYQDGRYAILSDIAGYEDHFGDMDFKVAGTKNGITAIQMDIKIEGVSDEILTQALEQARKGRLFILERMVATIAEPRSEMSVYAPRITTIFIPREKIREVIGPGGKTIRSITERTGVRIEIDDSGRVDVASTDESSSRMAIDIINELVAEAELGKVYLGRVQRIVDFGAFVEILPGTDGLLHISEIAEHRIKSVSDELKEGQELMVKVIEIDHYGKVRLSRKAVLQEKKGEGGAPPQGSEGGAPPQGGEGGAPPQRSDRRGPQRGQQRGNQRGRNPRRGPQNRR
ncbi:polyribonucleotide nucleotidyltransferase [Acidobacteriota bacterium]